MYTFRSRGFKGDSGVSQKPLRGHRDISRHFRKFQVVSGTFSGHSGRVKERLLSLQERFKELSVAFQGVSVAYFKALEVVSASLGEIPRGDYSVIFNI